MDETPIEKRAKDTNLARENAPSLFEAIVPFYIAYLVGLENMISRHVR